MSIPGDPAGALAPLADLFNHASPSPGAIPAVGECAAGNLKHDLVIQTEPGFLHSRTARLCLDIFTTVLDGKTRC